MDPQYGGQQPPNYGYTPGPAMQQGNGMAVAGLVLGIIGLVLCWFPFVGWLLALLGIIFGGLGMGKANKLEGRGKGMAIAGLALGIVALLLGLVIFVFAMYVSKESRRYDRYDRYGQVTVPYTVPADVASIPAPDRV
jgi:hypothetical protein